MAIREIREELALGLEHDFTSQPRPPVHVEFDAFSESTQTGTHCKMDLFEVEPASDEARSQVHQDPSHRWLSAAEIRSGTTGDGRPVTPTMKRLLEAWQQEREPGVVD